MKTIDNSSTAVSLTGMDTLCRNSIELIQRARKIAAKQINLVQLKIIQTLSNRLNAEFEKGFSVDTLENARKFYLCYQD